MSSQNNPWIVRRTPRDGAALRLFCLPHAGAGSVIFHDWPRDFPASVDVCVIEPPGRLARRREPAIRELRAFTSALHTAIEPLLDRPFAFFGYSLGALMAFECARLIRQRTQREPTHLIVAAHKAPQLPRRQAAVSGESKDAFVRELERRYGPLEPIIKSDPDMLDMIVDIMRVDLGMLEGYRYEAHAAFSCPVLAIGGTQDASLLPVELEGWREQTSARFRSVWMPGGHFFLRTQGAELRNVVRSELSSGPASSTQEQDACVNQLQRG